MYTYINDISKSNNTAFQTYEIWNVVLSMALRYFLVPYFASDYFTIDQM